MFPQSAQQVTAGSMPVVPTSPAGDHAVLVLDDSAAQRQLLCALLDRWGMRPIASGDPEEALQIAETAGVGLVICDWMMPQMTGPEFCRRLRRAEREDYAYVILLTSKSADEALSEGLASGADDFLTKPLRPTELRARLQAGARTVAMQRELVDKNRRLGDALTELRGLYDAIDADLDEARRLQHSFLQDAVAQVKGAEISLWLESSGHVGGDMVGYFEADRSMVGIHSIDVAGHGVASAMIGARVAAMLSGAAPDQNIALSPLGAGIFRAPPPRSGGGSIEQPDAQGIDR
ncbi:Serine phosphatase RsbU, regulator of sigma subunit [Roseibacterium elongatum DSM 19469]|uniref:Serine phosphatase RsbU, regulator of sigma subunit n=1 Tax=Roseicyclus elongatus DSM 19469 TaxID=1294273 RepID=W8S0A0_9RHOB|nr:response regulator [Roseibacterium elongatum]AHM03552.1 Serine phosphatase RsbU, regulator of sigma subunit [Roseibacterium elongatum DSM 19469]